MEQFIQDVFTGKIKITDRDNFIHVLNLKPNLLVKLIRNLDSKQVIDLLKFKDDIIQNDANIMKIFLLNSKEEVRAMILNDKNYLEHLLKLKENPGLKTWFDLISLDLKILVLENKKLIDKIDGNLFVNLVNKIKIEQLEEAALKLGHNLIFLNDDTIKHYLKGKFNLERQNARVRRIIFDKFLKNKHLTYYLFRIDSFEKLYIFSKFNLFIDIKPDRKNIIFEDGTNVEFKLLKDLNARHVNLLINMMKKNDENQKNHQMLLNAVKLYSIFGYDNSKKILDNKFTYMTEQAVDKTLEDLIVDKRRQYRIENQSKFFTHKMLDKVLDLDVNYIKELLEVDNEYANEVINKIKEDKEQVVKIITKEIEKRELRIKGRQLKEAKDVYISQNQFKRDKLTTEELYKLLLNVEVKNVLTNENGHSIQDEVLQKFLLGNGKVDNDCLLRRVLNKKAYGLNNTIDLVVNNFNVIKKIVENSNDKLSIYSLLDVVDITKVMIFEIPPDERDLTLESITKILNSRTYIDAPKEEILLRSRQLHKERRQKYYSSIPIVKKQTDQYTVEVIKFDDPDLITIGIDTNSCFKIGGGGEDLLRYCMTDPNGAIIRIYDRNQNMFMCPVVRNGNTLFLNGIDPAVTSKEQSDVVMKAVKDCVQEIMNKTNLEKIEMAIITNLNQIKFVKEPQYEITEIDEIVCIDKVIYTDYDNNNKFDRFIIAKDRENPIFNSYYPKEMFYLERNPNYFYCISSEEDLERINLLINSINFESISYEETSTEIKNQKLTNYKEIKVSDFDYVIGNKDWFIAVDQNGKTIKKLLNFDPRAKEEYEKEDKNLKVKVNSLK